MLNYFKTTDASLVKWSHGVNDKQKLIDSLQSDSTFLEADILKIDGKHNEPIMAHPPNTESDLNFSEFLHTSKSSQKGLKLDFKTQNAIEPCLETIKSIQHEISVPIILNADIFQGVNSPAIKIDPHFLIDKSLELYPAGVLSLGWTTTNDNQGNYRWSDVYTAFKLLHDKNILSSSTEVTFAVRLNWSINSVNRLIWLQKMTNCTFTLWSHFTDTIKDLDTILLFRKLFHNSLVYYDMQPDEYEHFQAHAYEHGRLENLLKTSTNDLIQSYVKADAFINLSDWNTVNGVFYTCDFGSLMFEHGATFVTKESDVVEFSGEFEIFPLDKANESLNNESSCVKISLRSDKEISTGSNSQGSISICIFTNGLVRIYMGDTLRREANLKANYHRVNFIVKDSGESNDVCISLKSYDTDSNENSVDLQVKADYCASSQSFYAALTLLDKENALGITALNILKQN